MNEQAAENLIRPKVTELVRRLLSAGISSAVGIKVMLVFGIDPTTAVAASIPIGAACSHALTVLFDWGWKKFFGPKPTGTA